MEELKNSVVREGQRIVKTFATRLAYVKESSIYKKLRGTGLTPELIELMDGVLEHEYVDGPTLTQALKDAVSDPQRIADILTELCSWLSRFRDKMAFSLGGVEFDKFILGEKGLCYIDFEHCKPGSAEEDVADIIAQLCFIDGPFSETSMEIANMFITMSRSALDWNAEILMDYLPQACDDVCEIYDCPPSDTDLRDLMWNISFEEI